MGNGGDGRVYPTLGGSEAGTTDRTFVPKKARAREGPVRRREFIAVAGSAAAWPLDGALTAK